MSTPPTIFKVTAKVALTDPVVTSTCPVNVEFTVGEAGNAAGLTEIVTVTGAPTVIVLLPRYALSHGTPAGVETDVETLMFALPLPLAMTTGAEFVFADAMFGSFEFRIYMVTADGIAVSPVTAPVALGGATSTIRNSKLVSDFFEGLFKGFPITNGDIVYESKMLRLAAILIFFAPAPQAAGPLQKPIGMIVSAAGDVVIGSGQTETRSAAYPGMVLFDGYSLRNVNGAVRFAVCAKNVEFTLAPGAAITFRGESFEGDAARVTAAGKPSFCELPMLPSPFSAAARDDSELASSPPLSPGRQAELARRLQPIDQVLSANPNDLSAAAARIAVLQQFQRAAETRKAAELLSALAPEATWTRGVHIAPPAVQRSAPGKTFALLIGISTYKYDPPGSLRFADKDAELFAQLLQAPRGGGLKAPQDIRILTNKNATRAAIDREVERLAAENAASPGNNTLVLFLAGHGAYLKTEIDPKTQKPINRDPYILTYDSNPQDAKTTGYPMEEFRRLIASQSGRFGRVLVFIDVCHANEIGPIANGLELEPAVRRAFAGENGEFGMMLATKSLAFESELFGQGHGAFTYFVVDGWNGKAAQPGSAALEFEDLAEYVETGVRKVTNRKQLPEKIVPDPALIVASDVVNKTGIQLAPAYPLPPDATARYRQSPQGKATIAPGAAEAQVKPPTAIESFEAAFAAGVLLSSQPQSASRYLEQIPTQQRGNMADRLLVALENRGQETILRYLEGDQIPQTKEDFVLGAEYFADALRLAPDSVFDEARMLFCQGRAQIFDRAYDSARKLLERSIRLDPARGYAYNALGIVYLEQIAAHASSFDGAIRAFRDAIRFAPYWAYPRHNLALAYQQRGAYADAIRTYKDAMALGPQYSYLPYNLGLLYRQLNELPLAETYYLLAKDRAERNPHVVTTTAGQRWTERAEIFDALGAVEAARKHWSAAEKDYRQALADDSQSLNARHNLALLLSRNGKSLEAEKLWKLNLAANPDHLPTLTAYAAYLSRTEAAPDAISLYERVAALRPDYAGVRRQLAALYVQLNDSKRALEELLKAAQSQSGSPELLEQIGDLEAQTGDRAAALASWREAATHVTDPTARRRLQKKLGQ